MSLEKAISKLTEVIKAAGVPGMTGMTGRKPFNEDPNSNGIPAGCTCAGPMQMGLCPIIKCDDNTTCMLMWDHNGAYYKCSENLRKSALPM